MDFSNLAMPTKKSKGRPKGSSANKVSAKEKSAMSLKEKRAAEIKLDKRDEEIIGKVTELRMKKFRSYKDTWEEEKKYRERFLKGQFKVKHSCYVNQEGWFITENPTGDLYYKPF